MGKFVKLIPLYIALINSTFAVVIITPPNVGDSDLKDLSTPDELESDLSLPDDIRSKSDVTNADELETEKRMLSDGLKEEDKPKIEITPKSTEISYEVKVTNPVQDDEDVELPNSTNQGNLRKISESIDKSKTPIIRNKFLRRQNKSTFTNPKVNVTESKEVEHNKSQGQDTLFEDNPPIDVLPDRNLKFGLINLFPLSKLYSVYLRGATTQKEFFDLPPNTNREEVLSHPYNSKVLQVIDPLLDQVKFNQKYLEQLNKKLLELDQRITNVCKNIKFTPANYKIFESLTLESKKSQEVWKNSYDFTKNKLIIMLESLVNVKNCISGNSMERCRKHFETVFNLLNLLDIFSPDTKLCRYSSLCKINLKKKVEEFLQIKRVRLDNQLATRDLEDIAKFGISLYEENQTEIENSTLTGEKNPTMISNKLGVDQITEAKHATALLKRAVIKKKNSTLLYNVSTLCTFMLMVYTLII